MGTGLSSWPANARQRRQPPFADSFKKGDMAGAMKSWQSGLDEMAQAIELAPENIFVRTRRGVVLISASRETPQESEGLARR